MKLSILALLGLATVAAQVTINDGDSCKINDDCLDKDASGKVVKDFVPKLTCATPEGSSTKKCLGCAECLKPGSKTICEQPINCVLNDKKCDDNTTLAYSSKW